MASFVLAAMPIKTTKAGKPCTVYTAFSGLLKPVSTVPKLYPFFTQADGGQALYAGHASTDDKVPASYFQHKVFNMNI